MYLQERPVNVFNYIEKKKKSTALAQSSGCKFLWATALCSSHAMLESEGPEPLATAPVLLGGNHKPAGEAGRSPVMKDAEGQIWDLCTIKFVWTENHCASLSLSIEGRLSPLSLLNYSGIYEYKGSWAGCECQSFLFWVIKKKIVCCYFSTLLLFQMQNILELSAPPVHYFPDFSFLNTQKQEGRSRKQK